MPRTSRVPHRGFIRLAAVAITIAAMALAYRRIDISAVFKVLLGARWGWFAAAGMALGAGLGAAAARWHLLLRLSDAAVHAGATWRMTCIGHFFNTILFGPAGGDFAKSLHYREWFRRPASSILASCTLDRMVGGTGFIVFTALAGFATFAGGSPLRTLGWKVPALPGPVILVGCILAAISLALLLRRVGVPQPLILFTGALRGQLAGLLDHPRTWIKATGLALLAHGCMNSVLLLCLLAVAQQPVPWLDLIWLLPVMAVVTSTTISIAGAGLREGAALVMFGWYGIPAADAVAAALLAFAVHIAWTTIGAVLWWRASRSPAAATPSATEPSLSVVIPTLNEAASLPETIGRLNAIPEIGEIIVADGGSTDDTVAVARGLGCEVVVGPRGRGTQLRAGGERARGDVILMVHADTWLPPGAGRALHACLRDPSVVGGGFWKTFRAGTWLMAGSRLKCAIRLWCFRRIAGDQVLFARKDALMRVGGVPDVPLMEEFELCRRLRRAGRLALAGATVTTSTRRFHKLGVLRTYARMWRVTLQYHLGVSTQALQRIYDRE